MKPNSSFLYVQRLQSFIKSWTRHPSLHFIKKILQREPRAKAYLVGGAVRDIALGKKYPDFDIVITGIPAKKLENILKAFGNVHFVGKTFGVFKLNQRQTVKGKQITQQIDIALPRMETSLKTGRRQDFIVRTSSRLPIEKDLERRDFTINAIALQLVLKPQKIQKEDLQKYIIDPHHGLKDLQKGIVRCVGDPKKRFQEDLSRTLRAIRFAVQLNFSIEKKTRNSIQSSIFRINKKFNGEYIIPREVIAKELIKIIGANPPAAIRLLDKLHVLAILMPQLLKMKHCPQPKQFHFEGDVWRHTLLALEALQTDAFQKEFFKKKKGGNIPQEVVWGVLFHDVGKPFTIRRAKRLRFDGHDIQSVKIFSEIAENLKLASAGLNVETVKKIIAKHMLLTNTKLKEIKDTTLEKYFFSPSFPGRELRMLMFADISATISQSGQPDFTNYQILRSRLRRLEKKILTKKHTIIPDILNGGEIMKILNIGPGPIIGKIKHLLREKQLRGEIQTKNQAKRFIKTSMGKNLRDPSKYIPL